MKQLFNDTAFRAWKHFSRMPEISYFPCGETVKPDEIIRIGFEIDNFQCFAVYTLKAKNKKLGAKYRKKELVFR